MCRRFGVSSSHLTSGKSDNTANSPEPKSQIAMEPQYNIPKLVTTDIRTKIPNEVVDSIMSRPPFVAIPGVVNARDIGGYTSDSSQSSVRPEFAYRSGALGNISPEGRVYLLRQLGITVIFDLRHQGERMQSPSPDIEGIRTVWAPYTCTPVPVDPRDFAHGDEGASGYANMYLEIMKVSGPTFQKVFEHIRDAPQEPFLFHCSAGKDRSGVLAALILCLAGSPREAIIHDYTLTRIGIEAHRPSLTKILQFHTGSGAGPESIGMLQLCNVRANAMVGFLQAIENSFEGGVEGYLKSHLCFNQRDLDIIRANLKVPISN